MRALHQKSALIVITELNLMQEVARREMPSENTQEDDLYAATHFNSDPALVVNVEQQLATSLSDLTQAHGSFPNNSILGDSLRTLLLPTGTSENRENLTKRSLSPSRRGFRRKENILATLNTKHGFRDATQLPGSPVRRSASCPVCPLGSPPAVAAP